MRIKASQLGRFNASRHGLVPQLTSAISGLLTGVIMVAGAWPGWMSPDSRSMFAQSQSRVFDDWHTPVLSWLWSFLVPDRFGPLGPFLLQQVFLWAGIALIAVSLSRQYGSIGALFPPAMLFFDAIWVSGWIWKDATALSLVALALGLAALGWTVERWNVRLALYVAAIFTVALVTATRLYMLPAVSVMAATLILMWRAAKPSTTQSASPDGKRRVAMVLLVATFVFGVVSPWAIDKAVIQPAPSGHEAALYYQDLARLQCAGVPGPQPGSTWIPEKFINPGAGGICDHFDLTRMNPLYRSPDPEGTTVVWPPQLEDIQELRSIWLDAVGSKAPVLIGARLMLAADFLRTHDQGVPRLGNQTPFFLAEGGWGQGAEVGWPSAGGPALLLGRLPSLVADQSAVSQDLLRTGLSTSILFPIAGLGLLLWRSRKVWIWSITGASVPAIWILNFAAVSPWNDARYVAPAAAWGILFSAILILVASQNGPPRTFPPGEGADDDSNSPSQSSSTRQRM